jgi:hypothetical protein
MNRTNIQNISNGDAGVNGTTVRPDFGNAAGGKSLPVVTEWESDSALRDLAIHFAKECPASCHLPGSPFHVLNSHYRGSLKTLVHGMTRAALLSLFEMERRLRQSRVRPATSSKLVLTN